MKRLLLLFVFASGLSADTLTVVVKGPKNQVTSSITVNVAPLITNINCVPGTVIEGDPVSCTVIIDTPAGPGGLRLSVLGAPGVSSFTIPAGQTGATFTFTAAIPPPAPPPAALVRPLVMPMRNGLVLGLPDNRFLSIFFYWASPFVASFRVL